MMLDWGATRYGRPELGEAAKAIETAVDAILARPESRTRDLGGTAGCAAFGREVAAAIAG
jgi:3-isopropylmalate dehydrogenase